MRYKERRWDFKRLVGSGGMSSSHSSTVSALAVAIGLQEGFGASIFVVALILACGVLNQIVYELPAEHLLAESRPLRELLGHAPPQLIISITFNGHARASLLPNLYWASMLPNIEMPRTLKDLVRPEFLTTLKSGHDGKLMGHQLQPNGLTYVYVRKPPPGSKNHNNIASQFFLDKSVYVGTKLKNQFQKTSGTKSPFLIREVADKYPFSYQQLPEILAKFSMEPKTIEADLIENTIRECEAPGMKGEEKYCTTSLESMVDLVTTKMGMEVTVLSTDVQEETNVNYWNVSSMVKKPSEDKALVCHKQTYPYAVFYCHFTKDLRAYEVGLVGAIGKTFNAIFVCHNDTSAWNPKHLAFQLLKVKPGTVPICHFLPPADVLWV